MLEKILALGVVGLAILVGHFVFSSFANETQAQQPPKQSGYFPVYPDGDNKLGLDPIGQRLAKDRIRMYELERRVEFLERVTRYQAMQIHQLQQLVFYGRIGSRPGRIGAGSVPAQGTPDLKFYRGQSPIFPGLSPIILSEEQKKGLFEGLDLEPEGINSLIGEAPVSDEGDKE